MLGRNTAPFPSLARPMSATTAIPVPPILTTLVDRLAEAVPRRARATFTELLIGAAVTRGGHVTDAILAAGLSRSWTSYYWFLQRGRWAWLAVWEALLAVLATLFEPPVWHVVIDDTVVERISAGAPGSLIHHDHSAKPNRPRFLRGRAWLILAAVPARPGLAVPGRVSCAAGACCAWPRFLRGRGWLCLAAVPARPGLAVPRRGGRAGLAGRGGASDAAPGPPRHPARQARERPLPAAPARAAARPGAAPARRLVRARPADRGRARRRPHRDRPRAPGPGSLRGPAAAPAAPSRPAAQVRRADDAGEGRGAAGAPERPD